MGDLQLENTINQEPHLMLESRSSSDFVYFGAMGAKSGL